ncbi:unnamed protein product [Phaeothamnion confervicola]
MSPSERVAWVLRRMIDDGLLPDAIVCHTAVKVLEEAGDPAAADATYRVGVAAGLLTPPWKVPGRVLDMHAHSAALAKVALRQALRALYERYDRHSGDGGGGGGCGIVVSSAAGDATSAEGSAFGKRAVNAASILAGGTAGDAAAATDARGRDIDEWGLAIIVGAPESEPSVPSERSSGGNSGTGGDLTGSELCEGQRRRRRRRQRQPATLALSDDAEATRATAAAASSSAPGSAPPSHLQQRPSDIYSDKSHRASSPAQPPALWQHLKETFEPSRLSGAAAPIRWQRQRTPSPSSRPPPSPLSRPPPSTPPSPAPSLRRNTEGSNAGNVGSGRSGSGGAGHDNAAGLPLPQQQRRQRRVEPAVLRPALLRYLAEAFEPPITATPVQRGGVLRIAGPDLRRWLDGGGVVR